MATNFLRALCALFWLACSAIAYTNSPTTTWADRSQKRFVVYLTGQHNVVPELPLVARVTHVALAFMRSEVFNVPHQGKFPLFTNVSEVRPKFKSGTKIQVAIGGWGNTDGFSEAARTEEGRKIFAHNVKAMIDATGADGVDIDWEYPGGNGEDYKHHPNSEKAWEIEAYPKLLAEIRVAIGPSKLLTAAVPGLSRDMIAFTWTNMPKIYESIDFLNVMTYDLMNRRDNVTQHHSGLDGTINALQAYTDPALYAQHLNVGLGFYIKWFRTASDESCDRVPAIGCRTELMEDPTTGADLGKAGVFSWHDEVPSKLEESYTRAMKYGVDDEVWELLKGHYFMDKEERIFWSWDTPDSIDRKLDKLFHFFKDNEEPRHLGDLGGVFAWGLGEDAPHFKHLKAVNKALQRWEDMTSKHQEL
ncbi:glycosyl hydrolase family 18 [Stagonosporopsis vannaccii]|nr:glycosyl hydrolase family 18 [Stagonosporopsis vannaccii]